MTRIHSHFQNYNWTTAVAVMLVGLAIAISSYGYWLIHGWFDWFQIFSDFYANISAELASIAITVIIIDRLNDHRRKREQIEDDKKRLIRNAGAPVQDMAISAISEIRKRGWLVDENGLLKGADLWNAKLEGANLIDANLQGAELVSAKLMGAKLRNANLQGADLSRVNLKGASLLLANLEGANLEYANLKDIIWTFKGHKFFSTLPDGTTWTPDTDMNKFTDPEHPEFLATLEKINAIREEMGIDPIG